MKGRIPILIFLFLCLFVFCPIVVADVNSGSISSYEYVETDVDRTDVGSSTEKTLSHLWVQNGAEVSNLISVSTYMNPDHWTGSSAPFGKSDVQYKKSGVVVGTGYVYFWKMNTDDDPAYELIYIKCYFDDGLDIGADTKQIIDIEGDVLSSIKFDYIDYDEYANINEGSKFVGFGYAGGNFQFPPGTYTSKILKSFYNPYNYWYNEAGDLFEFNITRDEYNTCMIKILNSGGTELINETSLQNYNISVVSDDLLNSTWYFTAEDNNGVEYARTFVFIEAGATTATIELNQTSYIDPENIEVEWEISGFDDSTYNYIIQTTATLDGDVSGNFWEASGNWNTSTTVSSETGTALFDFYSDTHDLPVWIKAEIWAYEVAAGTWECLDTSPAVLYHAGTNPSEISTDKSSYNVSEVVTVTYTSYADDIAIRAYQHGSITTYWKRDLATGTDNTVKFVFDEKDVGTWQIRLMENNVMVNYTSITITEGDIPYVKWEQSVYDEGQIAPYLIGGSGGLVLYSTDANATLSVFDAANTEIYNISVGSGSNKLLLNLPESAAPGVWTASLLNLGTHYNDTTVVSSSTPVISFNSSVYKTGETIGINYFLPGDSYRIMLLDANNKEIVIFTTLNGVISAGTYQTVPFPLTDNNIYGFDMISAIDAGTFAPGYWSVWVTDQYGTLVEDGTVWDRAKVTKGSTTPEDSSSEMISIFFSAEGLFMIFTAALTLMGLVAAKHPAGGGAGATIGVGFGVYFNALPVWLLMLTVILLVVLAGVSVAIYFKGK